MMIGCLPSRASSLVLIALLAGLATVTRAGDARAQLTDQTQTPNSAEEGIALSLEDQIGVGQGDENTPNSSTFIIRRDPARAVRRGRQLFQRKFTRAQGNGPRIGDGVGNIEEIAGLGAGFADSCAACHGRPRGSAGFGGDVFTRPDSRDAPHLFGLGLQEQLADEITRDLRALRDGAVAQASETGEAVTVPLESKGINFGEVTANPDGSVDTSGVDGIDADLRVRPFFADGRTISIREFIVGAFADEMGMEAFDPCLQQAVDGGVCTTAGGLVLDGSLDTIEAPRISSVDEDGDGDGVVNEIDAALLDFMEFYLLNYFRPGIGEQTEGTERGFAIFEEIGCGTCHIRNLTIDSDRRVADIDTRFDPERGNFNRLFAEASTLFGPPVEDGQELPQLLPAGEPFVVENIFTDFKRHDLGPNFAELNFDGTLLREIVTEPLWGVGSTSPYGHDGRSINLTEVILRHGGEAQDSRDAFVALQYRDQRRVLEALNSLILFPPDDTASNLDPGDPAQPDFPQIGHGSIRLPELFTTLGPE